jgi:hypothetical protein
MLRFTPCRVSPPAYDAIRQTLDASHFKVALRRAVRTVIR